MKKKLKIIGPVLLVLIVGGMGYKMFLKPKPVEAKRKIEGTLVQLAPEFVVNLAGGRYGKVSVALVTPVPPPPSKTGGPPELEQNDAIRAVVTDTLTGVSADALINRRARTSLAEKVLKKLRKQTDEHVTKVLFTDIAVQ